jgi:hypothetical protein
MTNLSYTTECLTELSAGDAAEILNLFRTIRGRTCSAANYLEYLYRYFSHIAIFVVRRSGEIVGFTQASAPTVLDPKTAWLPFSASKKGIPKKHRTKLLAMAEDWMRQKGAKRFKFESVLSSAALKRAWGMKLSQEKLYEKEL